MWKSGGSHKPMSCPAYGKECHNCEKNNHFSKYCKADAFNKKKVNAVEEEPKEFFVDAVHIKEVKDEEEWIVPLTVNRLSFHSNWTQESQSTSYL